MTHRRAVLAFLVLVVFASSLTLFGQAKDDKKQDEKQKKEIQNIVKIVDDSAAGQPAPNDLSLSWLREDVLKAQGNKEYVPFTVSLDPSKVGGGNVAFYWRVVSKGPAAVAAPDPAKKDDKKDKDKDKDKGRKTEYAYEDITFVPVVAGQNPLHISRSFTVPAGTYDVYLVAKEPTPDKAPKNAPPPKASVIKQTVSVPDFWNNELATSTVIIAQRNPKVDSSNKPDVSVEYNFYQKQAGAPEKFFNKTNPQNLNAQTLPPQFDLAAGHQLQSGQAVPLASFPEGDYRLEIKVTDKIANKTLTKEISFTVVSS